MVVAAALLFAACSGGDDDPSAAPARDTAPADTRTEEGAVGSVRAGLAWVDVPTVAARLVGPEGELLEWCLLLAATSEERAVGLMDAPDATLGGFDGMVFAWDDDTSGRFHMLDTEVPLSIAWFDGGGSLVGTADMDPCPPGTDRCPTFGAPAPYRRAVEVPLGGFEAHGVGPGWALEVTDDACKPR